MTFYPLATETWDQSELEAINTVVESRHFTMGKQVKAFEEQAAKYFGAKYCVMVNSGSSANLLAMSALLYHPDTLISSGDNIIVPAVSWSTTYYPVSQCGLELQFVDINPETLNIDIDQIASVINSRTKAIFAVNLLGNSCDYTRLQEICSKYNLVLLEDNCESMGSRFNNKYTGTFGLCGTFSTFFSHHISTMEGGFLLTDDEKFYHTCISLRAHGWIREQPEHSHLMPKEIDAFSKSFKFVLPGYNLRPLEMSGAIGQPQLQKLNNIIAQRRLNAKNFIKLFADNPNIGIQQETGESSWFGFSLVLKNALQGKREVVVDLFNKHGIECRPIIGGNFVNNPVIKYLKHNIPLPLPNAEYIDRNGLFIGNHHFDISEQLHKVQELISGIS